MLLSFSVFILNGLSVHMFYKFALIIFNTKKILPLATTSFLLDDDVFRQGNLSTWERSNSKPQHYNNFPMDKINSCSIFCLFVCKAVSLRDVNHNREEKTHFFRLISQPTRSCLKMKILFIISLPPTCFLLRRRCCCPRILLHFTDNLYITWKCVKFIKNLFHYTRRLKH